MPASLLRSEGGGKISRCNLANLALVCTMGGGTAWTTCTTCTTCAACTISLREMMQVAQVVQVRQVVQVAQGCKISRFAPPPKIARLQNEQAYMQSPPPLSPPASKITRIAKSWPVGGHPKIGKIDQNGQHVGSKERASFPSTM